MNMRYLSCKHTVQLLTLSILAAIALPAQTLTFKVISKFCGQKPCLLGGNPVSTLCSSHYRPSLRTTGGAMATAIVGRTGDRFADEGPGVIYKMTLPGSDTSAVYTFCSQTNCTDGRYPFGTLVQAVNGDLYGTTFGGGVNGDYGTVFRVTLTGTLTTLYSFCAETRNCADGQAPYAGLVQASNGNFYGTTSAGGANGQGKYGLQDDP